MINMMIDDFLIDIKQHPLKILLYLFILVIIIFVVFIIIKIKLYRYDYIESYDMKIKVVYLNTPEVFEFDENNKCKLYIKDIIKDKRFTSLTNIDITHDKNFDLCLGYIIVTKIDDDNIDVDITHVCDKL